MQFIVYIYIKWHREVSCMFVYISVSYVTMNMWLCKAMLHMNFLLVLHPLPLNLILNKDQCTSHFPE